MGFKNASGVSFNNCVGAIDGLLIWISKPTNEDANSCGVGVKKYFCGRKHKFGLNCQAVSDCEGKILDISIKFGGSSSDCLAFSASNLHSCLQNGLLHNNYVLFGDNAYLKTFFLATPFPNVSSVSKDNYNYYHSQLRI